MWWFYKLYRLENIKIRENLSEKEILEKACKQYKIKLQDIAEYKIFRCSIDARNKEDIFFNISLDIELKNRIKYKKLKEIKIEKEELIKKVERKSAFRPVIVGAGPSGLFLCFNFITTMWTYLCFITYIISTFRTFY